MQMQLFSFALIALGLPAAILVAAVDSDTTNVVNLIKHPSVAVTGDLITERSLGRQISRFRGIPYAQAPVGEHRFHRPQPWTPGASSAVDATAWSSQCTQMHFPHELSPEPYLEEHSTNTSEDCLYLNIWSPELKENVEQRAASLRPVMVWIHGGGLYFGSSSFELYNLETFASRADVVAVSLNYRLATLGFFYSDAVPEVGGNQGLWDQAMALQWVQENIAAFGGDPKRVTIIGESAGSWSVSAHLVSPVSRDLFSQAILMSGAVLNVHEPEKYVAAVLPGIRKAGCASEEDTQISKSVVECLQKLDQFVVDSINFAAFGMIGTGILVKDGTFFPDTPRNLLSSGNHKKAFNLLLSTVEDEAPFVVFQFPNDTRFLDNPTPITLEESKSILASIFKGKEGFNEAVTTKVYYSGENDAIVNTDAYRQKVSVAYGDYILGCPTFNFAKKLYASDQTSTVYQWYYTAKEGNYAKWMCKSWAKTCHTDDLFPAFGVPFRFPEKFTNRERDVSNEVIDFLKHFVRSGKPGPNQKEWQSYFMAPAASKNGKQEVVVAPYYEISNRIRSPESFKFNLKQLECETVWGQMPGL